MAKTETDKEWEARNDVDTLIRAQEIMDDPSRRKRALTEIQKRDKATNKAEVLLKAKTTQRLDKLFKKG
jgi:hypothetical protein